MEGMKMSDKLQGKDFEDPMAPFKGNKDFYRQNEVKHKQLNLQDKFAFDKSLDVFFKKFCKALMKEIEESSALSKKTPASYVN